MDQTFFELCSRYEGGIAGLAQASDLELHTLYRVLRGDHRKRPVRHVLALLRVLKRRPLDGSPVTEERLWALWEAAASENVEGAA